MGEATLHAFRLHENLYFIGTEAVSVHLLDTEAGLVLIDTGYPVMRETILENIRALGFAPESITAILHSHAHVDHFGSTREFVALSGAATYMSRVDDEIFNGPTDLTWAKELGLRVIPPFHSDVLVEDGDEFTFGKTHVRCLLTPGHTAGTLSFFITLPDGTVAAMLGGAGFNTMSTPFLSAYGLPATCREDFRRSLRRLSAERCELVLGNHPGQTNTLGKMWKAEEGKDVRDADEWGCFLTSLERGLDKLIERDPIPAT
ncbi:MAG: MBL fold metallo-hydrolase [Clostridia bacterium]|nr:MBL fold metallo-hydrolase [Clostridia bacterium]